MATEKQAKALMLMSRLAENTHERNAILQTLSEVDDRPAKLQTVETFDWYSIQNHKGGGHQLEIRETKDPVELVIFCHDCNRVIAIIE